MPQTMMIIIDNSLYAQNQDYLPSRMLLQKETVQTICINFLDLPENTLGVAPICPSEINSILTPTAEKFSIETFMSKISLNAEISFNKVFERSVIALDSRLEQQKSILLFSGSDIQGTELDEYMCNLVSCIKNLTSQKMYIVLFGQNANAIKEFLDLSIEGCDCSVAVVHKDDDFHEETLRLLGLDVQELEDDPDLALAISLSLEESRRSQ